jgi:hypothetical protein
MDLNKVFLLSFKMRPVNMFIFPELAPVQTKKWTLTEIETESPLVRGSCYIVACNAAKLYYHQLRL